MRSQQPVFFHSRWGNCKRCGHSRIYEIKAVPQRKLGELQSWKPRRLRDTPCARCGELLGRAANKRARGLDKKRIRRSAVSRKVERIHRLWSTESGTVRTSTVRSPVSEKPVETSAEVVARRKRG